MPGRKLKQFARCARIEKVFLERTRGSAWADIAYGCGFADQAHMINDFNTVLGAPPNARYCRPRRNNIRQQASRTALQLPMTISSGEEAPCLRSRRVRLAPGRLSFGSSPLGDVRDWPHELHRCGEVSCLQWNQSLPVATDPMHTDWSILSDVGFNHDRQRG
jgi:hypothetical protein